MTNFDPATIHITHDGETYPVTIVGWDEWRPITKAEGAHPAIPPGGHWVTMHPNGVGSKGNVVLVVPVEGHHGVSRVVGGAGGKLNGLRLHGIKDKATYEAQAKERRQDEAKQESERKAGLTPRQKAGEKTQKAAAKGARHEAEEAFIQKVLGNHGEARSLFEEGQDPATPSMSHKEKLQKARGVAVAAERRIMLDAESRVKAGLGQIGGQPGLLTLGDILADQTATGPGYRRALGERAEKAGLTAEKLAEKVAEIKGRPVEPQEETGRPTPVPSEAQADDNRELHTEAKALQAGKAAAMKQAVKEAIDAHGDLAQILKARSVMREAVLATAKGKKTTFEPGYQMTTTADATPDEDLVNNLHQQMLTQHVVQFLQEIGDHHPGDEVPDPYGVPPEGGMASARGAGAFDCLHETALAAIGQGVIERDTVEALGPEHSAMIVARAIRHEFTPEDQEQILQALEAHHLSEQEHLPEVVEEAQRLKSAADEMGADIAATPRDFALALEMQKQKISALKEARQLLGSNLGRLETRAALIAALRQAPQENLSIPIGRMSAEKAVITAAALGLKEGDYTIDHTSGEAVLGLNGQGQDRLIKPVDQTLLAEREVALAIKGGQMDEQNWRPKGFADRTATRYDNPIQEPHEFRRELKIHPEADPASVGQSTRDYVGGLMADGHDPASILADLHSATRKQAMSPDTRAAYEKALQEIAPLRSIDRNAHGKPIQEFTEAPGAPELDDQGEPVLDDEGNAKVGKPIKTMIVDAAGKPVFRSRMRRPGEIQADMGKALTAYLQTSGEANQTLAGQTVATDADFHEAMHRALAENPKAAAAFTPVGEMNSDQQGHLRDHFYKSYFGGAKNPEEAKAAKLHAKIEALGPEPPKENPDSLGTQMSTMDLLGEDDAGDAAGAAHSDAWIDWNNAKLKLEEEHGETADGPSPWANYVQRLGGLKFAQQAIQDEIRGQYNEAFHTHYQHLTGRALHLETKEQASSDAHLRATSGEAEAAALETARKAKQARLQKKGGGKFQSGGVGDRLAESAQAQALAQAEGGSLFGMDELDEAPAPAEGPAEPWQKPERAKGERYTLGQTMENLLSSNMTAHAGAFAGRRDPVKVREGMHMSRKVLADGTVQDFRNQQRCVKAILSLKRMGLFQGAGSGKTAIQMGALSQLHATGKLTGKAILAVPSIVQGQFGAEAIQFLDPTSGFKLHAQPGESWEERLRAYQDPGTHAVVITHQTLRDDSLRMLAADLGMTPEETHKHFMGLPKKDAAAAMKKALAKHGINMQALMVDEGHNALDRDGKEDSTFSRVMDAHSHNAEYCVQATANAMKNDVSEIHSELEKIDPHRYNETTKDEFMRRYGQHSTLAKRSLQQELTRHFYTGRVSVGVEAHHTHPDIALTAKQKAATEAIDAAAGKLRTGQGDLLENAKALAPDAFKGHPEEEHAAIAQTVQKSVGTYRENAMDRAINLDPEGGKIAHHVQVVKDRVAEGKPCIVFHGRLEGVAQIHAAMQKAGLRSVAITGKDSSKDKAAKLEQYNRGDFDVLVASDACQTGANLQRGKVMIHSTIPKTAMAHQQRTARIHRLGQTQDVEVITAQADHAWERGNWERVKRKDTLGAVYQSEEGWTDDTGLASSMREVRSRKNQVTGAVA